MKEQDINRIEMAMDFLDLRKDLDRVIELSLKTSSNQSISEAEARLKELESEYADVEGIPHLEALVKEQIFEYESAIAKHEVGTIRSQVVQKRSMAISFRTLVELYEDNDKNSEAKKFLDMQDDFLADFDRILKEVESIEPDQGTAFLTTRLEAQNAYSEYLSQSKDQRERVVLEANEIKSSLEQEKTQTKNLASVFQILAGVAFITGSILGITSQLKSERAVPQATAEEASNQKPHQADKTVP